MGPDHEAAAASLRSTLAHPECWEYDVNDSDMCCGGPLTAPGAPQQKAWVLYSPSSQGRKPFQNCSHITPPLSETNFNGVASANTSLTALLASRFGTAATLGTGQVKLPPSKTDDSSGAQAAADLKLYIYAEGNLRNTSFLPVLMNWTKQAKACGYDGMFYADSDFQSLHLGPPAGDRCDLTHSSLTLFTRFSFLLGLTFGENTTR